MNLLIPTALLAQACSIEQPVSGPVTLTGEWRTLEPPEPLRVGGKLEQVFRLHVEALRDADFQAGVVMLQDGQRHTVEGEVIDNEQTRYALEIAEVGGRHFGFYRAGRISSWLRLPRRSDDRHAAFTE